MKRFCLLSDIAGCNLRFTFIVVVRRVFKSFENFVLSMGSCQSIEEHVCVSLTVFYTDKSAHAKGTAQHFQ
jgi:hypothetical protein